MAVRFFTRGLVAAGLVMALLQVAGLVPAALAQQDGLVLELVETVPDPTDATYPMVSDGQVQGVDPYYGNFTIYYTWNTPPTVIGPEGFTLNLATQGSIKTDGGLTMGTGASGTGFSFDQAEPNAWIRIPKGAPGAQSAGLAVRVTPTNLTFGSTAELWVGASWGRGVRYRYAVAGETGQRDDGNGNGGTGEEEARMLSAAVDCDAAEIVISAMPSVPCHIYVSGWKRNTADTVFVDTPDVIDGWGNHANGLQTITASGEGDVYEWAEPTRVWPFSLFACPSQDNAGGNCYGSSATPGPGSVRFIVRQGDQAVEVVLSILIVARDGGNGGTVSAGDMRLGNLARVGEFLNTESGALAIGPIRADWLSAVWVIEPVGEGGFVRLANRWNQGSYLHTESQRLEAGPIQTAWHSAMWQMIAVPGTGFFWLENRYMAGQYLHVQNGVPEIGQVGRDWPSAMWWALP